MDTDAWTFRVWGKAQEWEDVSVPKQARETLKRWHTVQRPPSENWPVFTTNHAPSKYVAARDALGEAEVNTPLEDADADDVLRDHDIALPAVTTEGVRRVLERIAERADVDVDGKPPLPHGARRGLGDERYREDRGLAQDVLRHRSIRIIRGSYSYIEAGELGERVGDVLGDE